MYFLNKYLCVKPVYSLLEEKVVLYIDIILISPLLENSNDYLWNHICLIACR